ncbi:LCP family protein [Brevibacillus composti]|uniref:LCP family protein n=1 Tax=Brevibacillus composti TaxID=2796470 RepID=A0A7T5EIS5_9BACL|nr:LCP family protein [Brevibacillus composti]QQE73402.1 LCP family protein [Brevibacillus composti]QUO40483.1 LCP family protein [Brevibacillus composti]
MNLFSFFRTYKKRLLGYALFCLVTFAIASIGMTVYQVKQMTGEWYAPLEATDAKPDVTSLRPASGSAPLELLAGSKPLQPFSLLVLGIDSRDGERARSDTIMLAAVHPEKQRVYLLSIPRDTYMEIPGYGHDKLNHAMAYGGPKLVKESLEGFLDVRIDRYLTIDFDGFRKVVDALGGVPIDVKKKMKYTDTSDDTYIDLSPGLQTLSGDQALDYARYRKSDTGREDSDYERIKRQQELVQALAEKGTSAEAFAKAFTLMEILGDHVRTDLTEREIASLLLSYSDPTPNTIRSDTLTGADERIWHHDVLGWYHLVPEQERGRVRQEIGKELAP